MPPKEPVTPRAAEIPIVVEPEQPEPALSPELAEIYFTRAQILRILAPLNPQTFDKWMRQGDGPTKTVLPGRRIVWAKTDFFQWLKGRRQEPPRRRARSSAAARS